MGALFRDKEDYNNCLKKTLTSLQKDDYSKVCNKIKSSLYVFGTCLSGYLEKINYYNDINQVLELNTKINKISTFDVFKIIGLSESKSEDIVKGACDLYEKYKLDDAKVK